MYELYLKWKKEKKLKDTANPNAHSLSTKYKKTHTSQKSSLSSLSDTVGTHSTSLVSASTKLNGVTESGVLSWKRCIQNLEVGQRIGEGASAVVYEGKYFGQKVAIKKLNQSALNEQGLQEFYNEAKIWQNLSFKNIVQLYDVHSTPEAKCMIMELCIYTLSDLLHKKRMHGEIPWSRRLYIARDIVSGVLYLHAKGILHRDLKSMNVLLTDDGTVKICDFGMAKYLEAQTSRATGVKGTAQWLAPEIAGEGAKYTAKSDVYSMGIILWEIAARCPPYNDFEGNVFRLMIRIVEGMRPTIENLEFPNDSLRCDYIELMVMCWDRNSNKRPTFETIKQHLERFIAELLPMNDKLLPTDSEAKLIDKSNELLENGRDLYSKRNFKEAIIALEQAHTVLQSEDSFSFLWCSLMESDPSPGSKNVKRALDISEAFINSFPELPNGYVKKGDCLLHQELYSQAHLAYKEGLEVDPFDTVMKAKLIRCKKYMTEKKTETKL